MYFYRHDSAVSYRWRLQYKTGACLSRRKPESHVAQAKICERIKPICERVRAGAVGSDQASGCRLWRVCRVKPDRFWDYFWNNYVDESSLDCRNGWQNFLKSNCVTTNNSLEAFNRIMKEVVSHYTKLPIETYLEKLCDEVKRRSVESFFFFSITGIGRKSTKGGILVKIKNFNILKASY